MAQILVLVELNPGGSGVRKTTLEALTAARALGEPAAGFSSTRTRTSAMTSLLSCPCQTIFWAAR